MTIDGASGLVGGCLAAAVSVGGRGYLVYLHRSPDLPWIAELDDRAWLEQLLAHGGAPPARRRRGRPVARGVAHDEDASHAAT